jgi:Ca2+-binding RTX toxin-like protein
LSTVSTFDALLTGASWNGDGVVGRPAFITFSFDTAPAAYLSEGYSDAFLATFRAFTEAEQAAARLALKTWADASGITFLEVPAGQGDIRFGTYDFLAGDPENHDAAAYAYGPGIYVNSVYGSNWAGGGDVFVDRGWAQFDILLHEIGHAIGLKHPFEGDVILDPDLDKIINTVMSYDDTSRATDLGLFDRQAVAHIYGPNTADGTQAASWTWDAATATLTQVGAAGADTLMGVSTADVISGGAGNDRIFSSHGADRVDGDDGADSISGGEGIDTLSGGAGDDILESGGGRDVLNGGDGDDIIIAVGEQAIVDGGAGMDVLLLSAPIEGGRLDYDSFTANGGSHTGIEYFGFLGSIGDDTLVGGFREDELYAGPGHDSISGGDNWDWIEGGEGRDTVYGGGDEDWIEGNEGDDFLRGDGGDDEIWGDDGFDDAHGNLGEDTVHGGGGPDWVVGGQGNDLLFGDEDHDVVYGNLANDTVNGGVGNDWVRGGQGDDLVAAGDGDDFVAGDRGADTLMGGAGADRFHSFGEAGVDRIEDFSFAEGDRLNLLAGTTYTVSQAGADVVVSMGAGGQVVLVGVQLASLTGDWITVG